MIFNDIIDFMFNDWHFHYSRRTCQHTPPLLLGPPGIGKTVIGATVAKRMHQYMVDKYGAEAPPPSFSALDLSSRLPEDLSGVPSTTTIEGKKYTEFAPLTSWSPFTQPNSYGVLVLDDISAADKTVQIATRQLVLYRRVGEILLSPNVYLMVTGNRRDDQSGASMLPAHFRNSVCIMSLEPDRDTWVNWYFTQNDVDPIVASFLMYKGEHLSRLPKDSDSQGVFATPRTWHKLGQFLHSMGSKNASMINPVVKGLVGEGVGIEFITFRETNHKMIPPGKVLQDPKGAIPDPSTALRDLDVVWGLSIGLAHECAVLAKDEFKRANIFYKFIMALIHCFKDKHEYINASIVAAQSMLGQDIFRKMIHESLLPLKKEMATNPSLKEIWTKTYADVDI